MPFLLSASQVTHPLNPLRRMSSSDVKKYKGKRKSNVKFSQRNQESFIPAGLEWKPSQAVNSPHSVDWSMDGSGPTVAAPPFESSSRHTQHRSDVGSQRYTQKRSGAGSQRHTPQRSGAGSQRHRQQGSDDGSQHNTPDRGQFQRPAKFGTERRDEAQESKRLKVQERIDRRMRVLQTRKDRVTRRHARKEQKVQDHLDELERRRQIRIKGENHETKCGLINFPTFIELDSKKMKKVKKLKPNSIVKETTSTELVKNVDNRVNSMFRGTSNPPPASSNSHSSMRDGQPLAGSSRGPDNSRKDRVNSTDRYNSQQVPLPHQLHPVNSQQNTEPVLTPQARSRSEKEAHKVTSSVRGSMPQPAIINAQQSHPSFTQNRSQPDQYSSVLSHFPSDPTQARDREKHHSFSTPQSLSASHLPGKDLPSSPRPVAKELHHPSEMSHQTTSTAKYPSNGSDISRNNPPHQTPLSGPSSYITTQPKDTQISSISHTPNRDSPPHQIPSRPAFSTPSLLDTGDFALKNQLVKMYMTEEGTLNPTPEQNQRSEIELGWLRIAAEKEIQKTRIRSYSPISLSDHLKVQEQTNVMVQELLKEWVGEYTVNKKPIAYIIEECDVPFGNIQIAVQPPILIPRPETEQWTCKLSDMIKTWNDPEKSGTKPQFGKHDLKVLDIGTGSGCIPTYLAYNHPNIFVMGVDVDHQAIEVAKRNAFSYGLTFFQRQALQNTRSKVLHYRGQASFMNLNLFSTSFVEDVLNGLRRKSELTNEELSIKDENEDERFDMIISNPPYITIINLLKSKTFANQFNKRSQSFNQPIPSPSSSSSSSVMNSNGLLPKTVSMMQELGLKLPKKIRESMNRVDEAEEEEEIERIRLEKDDGLDFYKEILNRIKNEGILKKRLDRETKQVCLPRVLFEVGNGQAVDVKRLMIDQLKDTEMVSKVEIWNDFSGVGRVVVGF
ncbi:uncharacterized protein MELLADRAFT_77592 [Melampsora larici-populina 98AG31]|uniref:Type II methyltransferase M.TaqI-like domain-containing protein n=1 Tax=Melampsora larici-populina (strain 98AG31 / pathotype 3-4-7) TaxID=747676 RepID=F4RJK2_MELLP|nr:uncharacterized protein MELLADRAFT_77592 [Melampsora larici-populina 98AG31]EGG07478.1 hypothetical protein MELLADRAFT_77592 [Melampsora larici-populina 98AG31]